MVFTIFSPQMPQEFCKAVAQRSCALVYNMKAS